MKKETIGPKIKRFRKAHSLTQSQLAKELGYYDKSVISHIEKGDSDMAYDKILLLIKKYGVDANDLFGPSIIDELNKKNKVVVYLHGLHGSYQEIEDYAYLNNKYDIVGIDYQDGNPWEPKDTIISEFEKLTKGYKEIVLIGYSIGAFYAYEYLSSYKINKAFFVSPVGDMYELVKRMMRGSGISEEQLEKEGVIVNKIGQTFSYEYNMHLKKHDDCWQVPTHILYGANDKLIHVQDIINFLSNHPNASLTIKKDSEHRFKTDEEKAFIKNWILNNI